MSRVVDLAFPLSEISDHVQYWSQDDRGNNVLMPITQKDAISKQVREGGWGVARYHLASLLFSGCT